MSAIQVQNLKIAGEGTNVAVIGDVIDLSPSDARFSYSFAVASKPGGSSAAFTGAKVTPDVAGAYTLTVTAGTDVATFKFYVFSSANYSSLTSSGPPTNPVRSDATIRQMLRGLANTYPTATLDTYAAGGAFPPSFNARQWGDG